MDDNEINHKYSDPLDVYSDQEIEQLHRFPTSSEFELFKNTEQFYTENYEYFDLICDTITILKKYCKDHCLPIFDSPNTTSIILNKFI
jgi:hypothetical protein